MDAIIQKPVEIVQELLALHTTRKDVSDKLKAKQPGDDTLAKLTSSATQSDEFIGELMNELSNYGDAVMANVERENEYQQIWKATLGKLDSLSPREAEQVFISLESSLIKFYQDVLNTHNDLPVSLSEILNKQLEKLG